MDEILKKILEEIETMPLNDLKKEWNEISKESAWCDKIDDGFDLEKPNNSLVDSLTDFVIHNLDETNAYLLFII